MPDSAPIPVCIFAKPPVPGEVKTRLIPALGPQGAAGLARRMLLKTWQSVEACPGVRPVLATTRAGDFPMLVPFEDLWLQGEGDLGNRIERILTRGLREAKVAIALGADTPSLTVAHLQTAVELTQTHDAVLGPSPDGGFYLLALRRCPVGLFTALPWSAPNTRDALLERLRHHHMTVAQLESLPDIDTPEDLRHLRPSPPAMLISIIGPALNEATGIAATLRALRALEGEKELIVVDGGSTDATMAIAAAEGARVLQSAPGRGSQMHAGALVASGDVLWFVHADTIPPPHATLEIRRTLDDPSVTGGNFGLVFDGRSRAARQLTAIYPALRWLGLCYGDSGIFIRHADYRTIGGFRPIALFEDLDILRRMRKTGRFVHIEARILTSSRRFEQRNFALVWLHWTTLQVLYWCGVSPNWLARWYRHVRRTTG